MKSLKVRLLSINSPGSEKKMRGHDLGDLFRGHNPMTGKPLTSKYPYTGEVEVLNPGGPPAQCRVPMSWVERGRDEGWLTVEGERLHQAPGGPPEAPWRRNSLHTFTRCDRVVLKTPAGTLRYRVTHQPGSYYASDGAEVTGDNLERYGVDERRVDWFFELELEK